MAAAYEKPRSWDHYQPAPRPMLAQPYMAHDNFASRDPYIAHAALLAEDQSDSDVSDTPGYDRQGSRPKSPRSVARLPLAGGVASIDTLQARLRELETTESFNSEQQQILRVKRDRKDGRIRQRREVEDRRISALYEARRRHDARIEARRAREDEAFKRAFAEMDEEDGLTRNRLKRLKRGLPMDDPNEPSRTYSMASSGSPTTTSTMPPAKRHQPGPPDSGYGSYQRPPVNGVSPSNGPGDTAPSHPSYQFYQSTPQSYSVPYHQTYGQSPHPTPPIHSLPSTSTPGQQAVGMATPSAAPRSSHGSHEHISIVNGATNAQSVIHGRQSMPHMDSPGNSNSRPGPKEYNTLPPETRPPPAGNSGFASINPPSNSGFAAINPRLSGQNLTLSVQQASGAKPIFESPVPPDTEQGKATPHGSGTPVHTPTAGKRTPSTTHPYSQSEAFANRHHHCEKTDQLGRGIWTSFGPGGSQDAPTGPPVEMYLRCNHDDCRRIDWRTVHGLQCHIVKSHEQPKGTIGSLEKALDRYGVPVKDVEKHEEEHGLGSGGTMADPKNLKIKNKTREAQQRQSLGPSPVSRLEPGIPSMSASPPPGRSPSAPNSGGVRSIGFKAGTEPLGGSHMFPGMSHKHDYSGNRWSHRETGLDLRNDHISREAEKPAAFLMRPWNGPNELQSVSALNKTMELPRERPDQVMRDAPPPAHADIDRPISPKTFVVAPTPAPEPPKMRPADGPKAENGESVPRVHQLADAGPPPPAPTPTADPLVANSTEHNDSLSRKDASDTAPAPQQPTTATIEAPARATTPPPEATTTKVDAGTEKGETVPKSPAPPPQSTTSPRTTRKPVSRRASVAQPKAETTEVAKEDGIIVAKEEKDITTGKPEHQEPKNEAEEEGDSITVASSPRQKNKENPQAGGRPRRQTTGRFARKSLR